MEINVITTLQEAARLSDTLAVGLFSHGIPSFLKELDAEFSTQLEDLLQDNPKLNLYKSVTVIHTLGRTPFKHLYLVGLGEGQALNSQKAKEVMGTLVKALEKNGQQKAAIAFDTFIGQGISQTILAHAIAEAAGMASYHFEDYKKREEPRQPFESLILLTKDDSQPTISEAVRNGSAYAKGVNVARSLVNTPANFLTPIKLADHAKKLADHYEMSFEVLDEKAMKELGMGALLGVSQGSDEPPRLIIIKYQGKSEWKDPLTFVGKGVTFDSGGYSLKTAQGMMTMKTDMGGAASVLGALSVIGELKPEVNVMGVIPTTENMVNGSALKPGDVITASNGKTIEVNNTDAEGRLILADALAYSVKHGAGRIVDLATLTGAIIVTFGSVTTGAVTNNDEFYAEFQNASEAAGEWVWELPHHEPYKEMVKQSDVADLINAPGRGAGSITAAMFLHEFVGDNVPWVHLDIAGTAFSDKPSDLGPKGATGVMVRTLAELARKSS